MKHLFLNNDLTWSKDAEEIAREAKVAKVALRYIMDKWSALGCSPREIAHILFWATHDTELDFIIDRAEKT